jgi:Domain of unknown function (DUF4190)
MSADADPAAGSEASGGMVSQRPTTAQVDQQGSTAVTIPRSEPTGPSSSSAGAPGYGPPPAYPNGYYGAYPYSGAYYPYPYYAPYPMPVASSTSGWAIASLIVAIAGSQILPVVGAILGAIFGHIALGEINRSQGRLTGRGLAIGGIVVGYIMAGLQLTVIAVYFYFLVVLFSQQSG